MLSFLNLILDIFRRTVSESEERPQNWLQENSQFKSIRGTVTAISTDFGWINESIFFNTDVVCGHVSVNVGANVIALVEEVEGTHALKAIKVKILSFPVDAIELSDQDRKLCIWCVTMITADTVYVNSGSSFPVKLLQKGFRPFKGDLLLVDYYMNSGTSHVNIQSVNPLTSQNVNEVCITELDGTTGVLDDYIFFTMDSIYVPFGYIPQLYDIVNVITVDSIQSQYKLRAVTMIPLEMLD